VILREGLYGLILNIFKCGGESKQKEQKKKLGI